MQFRLIENGVGNYIIQQRRDDSIEEKDWTNHYDCGLDLNIAQKKLAAVREKDVEQKKKINIVRVIE